MENDKDVPSESNGKVQRNIHKYGLAGLGDEMVTKWTADDDRMSLRSLADMFNKAIVEAALENNGTTPLPGRVNNIYNNLTGEDVTSGIRVQTRNELREEGVDIDALTSDFVTRQSIHTYLTKERNTEYTSNDRNPLEQRRTELQKLESRHTAVAESSLASLRDSDELTLGQFQVLVSLQVQCSDCGSHFTVSELLERGGCECSS